MLSLRAIVLLSMLLPTLLALPARAQQGTLVRVHTSQGPIDLRLLDTEAPTTVANFLAYLRGNDWRYMFFHRSARLASSQPFVLQGGGFRWPEGGSCCAAVKDRGQIQNEFAATRSNLRGTVAMAKLSTGPNTATNQWFINLGDNGANLNNQNGGFTVFARITTPGMVVADRIAALRVVNAGSPFNELPVVNFSSGQVIQRNNVVLVSEVSEFPPQAQQSESDRVFNYLEAAYPQYLSPSSGVAGSWEGFTYRYYSASNSYVATKDGKVWYLVPALGPDIGDLGSVADWLAIAHQAGY